MRYIMPIFIIVPVIEIALFIWSGRVFGFLPTILFMILSAIIGAYLTKRQGLTMIRNAQRQLSYGQIPGNTILDGICLLFGGIYLMTPGFLTDTIGLLFLIPFTRKLLKPVVIKMIKQWFYHRQFKFY